MINPNGAGETAHSGTWYAWLDGYGTTHTDTLSQTVTIPAGCTANLNHANGYQQHSYSLSGFAGQSVTLKFSGTEDISLQTSFVVDDTAVTAS